MWGGEGAPWLLATSPATNNKYPATWNLNDNPDEWKYFKEHWQYHLQEMDLELLKGHWNNWVCIIVVYLDELCTFTPNYFMWRRCDRQECERAIAAWRWDFVQRKVNKPKNGLWIVKATLRSIYCGLLLFGRFCLNSVISWYLPSRLFFVADAIYQSYWCNFYGKCCPE